MITLVTGGARSGKSKFAENIYKDKEDVVYIATSKIFDREMENRVAIHKATRPSIWRTYEGNYNLTDAIDKEENYLLDCITVLTSNIMFDYSKDVEYIDKKLQEKIETTIFKNLEDLIYKIRERDFNLVLVTNEVGDSIVPEHHISRVFRDIQGRINQRLASISDKAYLICCGLPVELK
ncbi:MAG: bifunctional adenosylcobinamide kinase/adenosylcobinamide-phosphate guanylyltransferase [Tissierella sp.]|uniref:bifunctional adenosylcobinamide kinase/adenosylcobinamide-phosphate guanylyltransferase n=1 Tax=Tissierella sp. TaxID=41274 RepID=UPI003F9A4CB0